MEANNDLNETPLITWNDKLEIGSGNLKTQHLQQFELSSVDLASAVVGLTILSHAFQGEVNKEKVAGIQEKEVVDVSQILNQMPQEDLEKVLTQEDDQFVSFDEDSDEEEFFDCEDVESSIIHQETYDQQIASIRDTREILIEENELEAEQEEEQIIEEKSLTFFENLTTHLGKIAGREGTTLVTALTTVATGAALGVTLGGVAGTVLGTGGLLVAGNEAIKMIATYLNAEGASDHLEVIENALENIKSKNEKAEKSILRSLNLQSQIEVKMGLVDKQIEQIQKELTNADQTLAKILQKTLSQLNTIKEGLVKQGEYIEKSIDYSKQTLEVLTEQKGLLEELMSKNYTLQTDQDIQEMVDEIKREIQGIHALSIEAYEIQLKASNNMMKAAKINSLLSAETGQTAEFIEEIHNLGAQLKEASLAIAKTKDEVEEAKFKSNELREELDVNERLVKEQKIQIEIAEKELELEKQVVKFDELEVRIGAAIAMATGSIAGFLIAGPIGAIAGGLIGVLGLAPFAARSVHYARKMMSVHQSLKQEAMKKKLTAAFAKMKSTKKDRKVEIEGKFGFSQGNIMGTWTPKFLHNLVIERINKMAGGELFSEWRSSVAGSLKCTVRNITFPIAFNKKNSGAEEQGAISALDQQDLNALLLTALDEKKLTPQTVLDFLKGLEEVPVGKDKIAMIKKDSSFVQEVKNKAKELLKNQ